MTTLSPLTPLFPRQQDLSSLCTPHSTIITAFYKYNLIAIFLSLASNLLSYYLLRRRRPFRPGRATLSITGQIAFAILGAYLTGLVIQRSCPPGYRCPSAAYGLVVWATRPRATAGVFLVNLPFALWRRHSERRAANPVVAPVRFDNASYSLTHLNPKDQDQSHHHAWGPDPASYNPYHHAQHNLPTQAATTTVPPHRAERENLFLKTCITASMTELFLCFIGVPIYFLPASANTAPYQPDPKVNRFVCLFDIPSMYLETSSSRRHYTLCSPEANSTMGVAAIGMLGGFVLFALAVVAIAGVGCSRREKREEGYILPVWTVAWVPLVVATVFTWIMWVTFLKDTGDEEYCVGNMGQVDAVNIVQIVVMNIWRQVV
ncbi:hypothetical protein B0T16DRAFT_456542 [Cercophora newfieldiana]|uniref:Uncharacterized protein n=1 Tax=Cercophora newfieldiana TaxID=92897 RepID=A0AA40CU45_9PEZI|nr:hypothetical protein B0T16DRAFT_456542 [Cercophora newfieldiana]